ncbi:MAG: ribonuclease H-like domain-containing protein [Lachnospiraceae bacterium]|nr:ribonuclease H-like domain-containing protein [Lachnospiraceae bacterium]
MEIIKDKIQITDKNIFSYIDTDDVFCDIETLGFSSKKDPIYMIGCAKIIDDNAKITLFFAGDRGEENNVLDAFFNYIKEAGRIITYNGDNFDLPFISDRAQKYGYSFSFDEVPSLDILKEIRKIKNLTGLKNCKQKTVEKYLGIDRKDKYDGGELIGIYKAYELRPEDEARTLLIQHNRDDVFGLINLMPILSYLHLSDAKIFIEETDFSSDKEMVTKGTMDINIPTPLRISDPGYYILFEKNRFSAVFPLVNGRFCYHFFDHKNYVYLQEEDIAVPKALAASVPKERKEKATALNCYNYIDCNEKTLTNDLLSRYIKEILRSRF